MRFFRSIWLACALLLVGVAPAWAAYPGENGRIAYVGSSDDPYVTALFTIAPTGGDPAPLTGPDLGEDQAPSWSRDGQRVVFERRTQGEPEIRLLNADGTGDTFVVNGLAPAISPDGGTVVFGFHQNGDLYAVDADGSNRRRLTDEWGHKPSFSPDGSLIAFESQRLGWSPSVFLMRADGSDERLLVRGEAPDFSPDGTRIVFQAPDGELHVIGVDGTGETGLGIGGYNPVFSPDGKQIAFSGWENNRHRLEVVDADGTDGRILLEDAGFVPLGFEPSWQPIPPVAAPPAPDGSPPAPGPPAPDSTQAPPADTACGDVLNGTARGERLTGSRRGDRISGLGGADHLSGGGGVDCLLGGGGHDRIAGGSGDDRLGGEGGRDRIAGGAGDDRIGGGTLSDVLSGGPGDDSLGGGSGADVIDGDGGSDTVRSGPGSDRIDVRDGEPDRVDCGRGWDRVIADGADDVSGCERVVRSGRR